MKRDWNIMTLLTLVTSYYTIDGSPLGRFGRWQRQEDYDCAERRAAQAGSVTVHV